MCLIVYLSKTNTISDKKPLIAERDIIVYKGLTCRDYPPIKQMIIDRHTVGYERGFHYYNTTPFRGRSSHGLEMYISGNCFHSCVTHQRASMMCSKVVKMIIPKGALYYTNGKEYASSEIIYPKL